MTLNPYRKTKPSGVEWLGDVPEHWEVSSLFRQAETIQTGHFGSQLHAADYVGGGIPLINPAHICAGRIIPDEQSAVDEFTALRLCRHRLRSGDIVMARRGEIGRCAQVTDEQAGWLCGTGSLVVRLRGSDSTYVSTIISSSGFSSKLELNAVGTTMLNLNPTIVGRMLLPVPPLHEQRAIAAFLDRESGRIDGLVAKKRELIERLKEKRSALISRTVTRGLPPAAAKSAGLPVNPPMKDSGIEWLGEIPKQWDVVPYKRVCTRVDVGIAEAATHAYCDDGVPIVRSTNVKPNRLETADVLRVEPWFAEKNRSKTLRAGDLVTVRTGYPGTTAVVPPALDGCQCFTLVLSSPKRTAHGPFFSWFMNSQPGVSYFEMEGWGTAQTNISVPIVQFMPVPHPPLPEQHAIAAYLDAETAKLDALVAKVEEAVERLQEYRSALITAAVTGKIDVRNEAKP